MTTRVHIINFGPGVVEVNTTIGPKKHLYPNQYLDEYVYDNQGITIKEETERKENETK